MYELTIRPPPGGTGAPASATLKVALTVKPSPDQAVDRRAVGVNVKAVWRASGRVVESVDQTHPARSQTLDIPPVLTSSLFPLGSLEAADIILDSGNYRPDMVLVSKTSLQPGAYTLIASAASPVDEAEFAIDLQCTAPVTLRPIPAEGAGLFLRTVNGSWYVVRAPPPAPSADRLPEADVTSGPNHLSRTESTSYGSPTFGKYWRNPTSTLRLHKDADVL